METNAAFRTELKNRVTTRGTRDSLRAVDRPYTVRRKPCASAGSRYGDTERTYRCTFVRSRAVVRAAVAVFGAGASSSDEDIAAGSYDRSTVAQGESRESGEVGRGAQGESERVGGGGRSRVAWVSDFWAGYCRKFGKSVVFLLSVFCPRVLLFSGWFLPEIPKIVVMGCPPRNMLHQEKFDQPGWVPRCHSGVPI